jgi:hypothetical protein
MEVLLKTYSVEYTPAMDILYGRAYGYAAYFS